MGSVPDERSITHLSPTSISGYNCCISILLYTLAEIVAYVMRCSTVAQLYFKEQKTHFMQTIL